MVRAVGIVGQSNADGFGDLWQWIALGHSYAALYFYQDDISDSVATSGKFTAADFDPGLYGVSVAQYDYPVNLGGVSYGPHSYRFGPELEICRLIASYHGDDVYCVKTAVGATYIGDKDPFGAAIFPPVGWWCPWAHRGWGDAAAATPPYSVEVKYSGTATSIAGNVMTDSGASWTPGALIGLWISVGGMTGCVIGNSSTQATVFYWARSTPTAGPYQIQAWTPQTASLARVYAEQILPAAASAESIEIDSFFVVIGEYNSLTEEDASRSFDDMLDMIWRLRNGAVAAGATSLQAHEIIVVLAEVKEGTIWPYAAKVNASYRAIAECDPMVVTVSADGVSIGGLTGTDQAHYDAAGQIELGRRMFEAYKQVIERGYKARRSLYYQMMHEVVQPIWGYGPDDALAMTSSWSAFAALPASSKRTPGLFVPQSSRRSPASPLFLDAGTSFSSTGTSPGSTQATRVGVAFRSQGAGMVNPDRAVAYTRSVVPFHGSRKAKQNTGYVWSSGAAEFNGFEETVLVFGSDSSYSSPGAGGKITRWRTTTGAIDREWMCRGYSGVHGLSMPVILDEVVSDQGVLWMRHQLGLGDHRKAQAIGDGAVFLAPTIHHSVDHRSGIVRGKGIAMEFGSDASAPVPAGLTTADVDHGGDASSKLTVMAPRVTIEHMTQLAWQANVHRSVWTATFEDAIRSVDTLRLEPGCWSMSTFGKQFVYDPATGIETDLGWSPASNYWHEITTSSMVSYTPAGAVAATVACPFTRGWGLIGWEANGAHGSPSDGLTWALFVRVIPQAFAGIGAPYGARLGNKASAPAYPAYASYDQLDHVSAQVLASSTGVGFSAGGAFRLAMFLLTGTMAQVKAAANALYASRVDASWTT